MATDTGATNAPAGACPRRATSPSRGSAEGGPSRRPQPLGTQVTSFALPNDGSSVGANIAASRRRIGLTQRDFASALGVSPYLVERIERDRADPAPYRDRIEELTGLQ